MGQNTPGQAVPAPQVLLGSPRYVGQGRLRHVPHPRPRARRGANASRGHRPGMSAPTSPGTQDPAVGTPWLPSPRAGRTSPLPVAPMGAAPGGGSECCPAEGGGLRGKEGIKGFCGETKGGFLVFRCVDAPPLRVLLGHDAAVPHSSHPLSSSTCPFSHPPSLHPSYYFTFLYLFIPPPLPFHAHALIPPSISLLHPSPLLRRCLRQPLRPSPPFSFHRSQAPVHTFHGVPIALPTAAPWGASSWSSPRLPSPGNCQESLGRSPGLSSLSIPAPVAWPGWEGDGDGNGDGDSQVQLVGPHCHAAASGEAVGIL